MTLEEIKFRRLAGHHLLAPADSQSVVKDLCGLQAQFLSYALHGLSMRSENPSTDGMIKSWTNRGTMHLFSTEDLPLFLHEGRNHFLRPVDTLEADAYLNAGRKAYFADLILDAISQGVDRREELKFLCEAAGMTEGEGQSLFDPWGGIIRALCESGKICHKVQESKAYQFCPAFEPMPREQAELELSRRYFTHFGPASIQDAAYFFGTPQTKVRQWLKQLPVAETALEGKCFYYLEQPLPDAEISKCLFLAGFDQLMLGYEKKDSLFLPNTNLREIFTLSGIVRPAILINGTVAGWWNLKNKKLTVNLFEEFDRSQIEEEADKLWPNVPITFRKV